jgi:hypothetical protein
MTTPKARAESYAYLFEQIPEGKLVMDELLARFGRNPYVKGGIESARQTDFNAGALEVINFIVRRIERAHQGGDDEQSVSTSST